MEFRILGSVEVVNGGRVLALGPSKQRALLAVLLLHVNEVVSRDRLIEDLWGELAPETATTALHGYVSQLRKVLEESNGAERRVLVTRAPGYLLELDPGQVDLKRFELLTHRGGHELAAGEAEAAAATLAQALSLWRGPPLAEFSSTPFALAESLRLQELRISALEDRVQADLALGHHDELVGELEMLVAEHPFRERLQAQLMLALYRCGRQADALETYRKARRRLVEELGIEPGPVLQDVEQAILRHEVAIAPAAHTSTERTVATPASVAEPAPERTRGLAPPAPKGRKRRLLRRPAPSWRAAAVVAAIGLAAALLLGFALNRREETSIRLAPNSVGFIDAESGRVTRQFPVGREPRALAFAFDSVWVANYRDTTVTRIDRTTGLGPAIPVGGHPTAITATASTVWVWTLEGRLVPIHPQNNSAGAPIHLHAQAPNAGEVLGGIAAGGGFLCMTAPPIRVICVEQANPRRRSVFVPNTGAVGPIGYRNGKVWVAGSDEVVPVDTRTGVAVAGVRVGTARDLAFSRGDLWVVSGGPAHAGGVAPALRRIDLESGLQQAEIRVGSDADAVTAAGGSIWAASGSDGTVSRIDPKENRVIKTISVGASPTALAVDGNGLWVAVR